MSPVAGTKRPIFRYLILACLLVATMTYEGMATKFRHADWFGQQRIWKPFFIYPPDKVTGQSAGRVGFLDPEAREAGLHEGDIVTSINGRPLTGTAILGEESKRTATGSALCVTTRHRNSKGVVVEETLSVRRPPHPPSPDLANTIMVTLLPYLPVVLGFWVAFARPQDPLAWLVLALMLVDASFYNPGPEYWPRWLRDFGVAFRYSNSLLAPIWLLLFGIYFPESFPAGNRWESLIRRKWIIIGPYGLFAFASIVLAVSDLENWNAFRLLRDLPVWIGTAGVMLGYLAIALGLVSLATKYRGAISLDSKRRLRLLFAGGVVSVAPFFLTLLAQIIGKFSFEERYQNVAWITYFLFFLFPFVLAYVILVHRALDVRIVLRQGLQYALAKNGVRFIQLLLTIAIFSAAVILVAGNSSNRLRELAVILVGLVLIWAIGQGSDQLRRWVDKRFFRESYSAELVLSELSDQVRTMVEPKSLLQTVVDRISGTLHIQKAAALLVSGNPLPLAYFHGYSTLPELNFSPQSATMRELEKKKGPIRVDLDEIESSIGRQERRELAQLGAELLLPLSGREKLLGFLSLGAKRSEEPFTSNDLRLLKSVAVQTGLALENAQLMAAITEEVALRERLNREVEIAREVQERLFPQHLPLIEGLDYSGACRPALGVGGDYYDFLALPGGGLGVAIGDVSGKGISAALLMASLEASLRAEAARAPEHLPDLVSDVNRLVYKASSSNRYATFFYGQYAPTRREFTYVNAGHNPPLLFRRRGRDFDVTRLTTGGSVVGLFEDVHYQQEIVTLEPGDMLVAFTDGITEAMDPAQEEWGEENLIDTVKACAELKSTEILACIMQAADAFTSSAKQHDDMTLIVIVAVAPTAN
jgi:phosphoserine phosphatase RsbU/P